MNDRREYFRDIEWRRVVGLEDYQCSNFGRIKSFKKEQPKILRQFNNCVENLRWVTGAENQQYALDSGARKTGTAHPDAKLTAEAVFYIRTNPDKLTLERLAAKFGVCRTTIKDVRRKRKYRNEVITCSDKS